MEPWLARLDMEALAKVEEGFQADVHGMLLSMRTDDEAGTANALSWARGARAFISWVDAKRRGEME